MHVAAALGLTALVGVFGTALLAPPALPLTPQRAAILAPANADMQLSAARQAAVDDKEISSAAAGLFAKRALVAMPFNQGGVALAAEVGEAHDRTQAINLAAALGWRDTLANVRLLELALLEENPAVAAQRIDAIGRTQGGEFAAGLADRVMTMESGPQALSTRAAYRSGSRWWITYLRIPPTDEAAQEGRMRFLRGIDRADGAWLRMLVTAASGSLIGAEARNKGYALWRDTVASAEAFGPVLYDEKFQHFDPDSPPLGGEWRLRPNSPFAAESLEGQLRLSRLARDDGIVLEQVLLLEPGNYRLSARGRSTGEALSWNVVCNNGRAAFSGPAAIGEWDFAADASCDAASLRLIAGPSSAVTGDALLEQVSLERLS